MICNKYAYLILLCGEEWCDKNKLFLQAFNSGTLPKGGGRVVVGHNLLLC